MKARACRTIANLFPVLHMINVKFLRNYLVDLFLKKICVSEKMPIIWNYKKPRLFNNEIYEFLILKTSWEKELRMEFLFYFLNNLQRKKFGLLNFKLGCCWFNLISIINEFLIGNSRILSSFKNFSSSYQTLLSFLFFLKKIKNKGVWFI